MKKNKSLEKKILKITYGECDGGAESVCMFAHERATEQILSLISQREEELLGEITKTIDEFIWGIEEDNVIEYFVRLKEKLQNLKKE